MSTKISINIGVIYQKVHDIHLHVDSIQEIIHMQAGEDGELF